MVGLSQVSSTFLNSERGHSMFSLAAGSIDFEADDNQKVAVPPCILDGCEHGEEGWRLINMFFKSADDQRGALQKDAVLKLQFSSVSHA